MSEDKTVEITLGTWNLCEKKAFPNLGAANGK
jgi:hypothetical protein